MTTIAVKTLAAINAAIEKDQGAKFRYWQGQVFPHMKDAFRSDVEPGFRTHLGASMIGRECARSLWYGFRWSKVPKFNAKTLRLFNRGHLEEARFIAMLLMIGVEVFQQDSEGRQYAISHSNGHFGGSGDGVALGIPDVPAGYYVLLEFKTHGEKSFLELVKKGVRVSKPEHYVQMITYMHKMGLVYALYMAVNKNTDDIHAEIVVQNPELAQQYLDRGEKIIYAENPPPKISTSGNNTSCLWCEFKNICKPRIPAESEAVALNCRTCKFSEPCADSKNWNCRLHKALLDKDAQLKACDQYEKKSEI